MHHTFITCTYHNHNNSSGVSAQLLFQIAFHSLAKLASVQNCSNWMKMFHQINSHTFGHLMSACWHHNFYTKEIWESLDILQAHKPIIDICHYCYLLLPERHQHTNKNDLSSQVRRCILCSGIFLSIHCCDQRLPSLCLICFLL